MREVGLLPMPVQLSIFESRDQDSEAGSISIKEFVGLSASRPNTDIESEFPLEPINDIY